MYQGLTVEGENGGYLRCLKFHFHRKKKISEIVHTEMWIHLTKLDCPSNNGLMINFMSSVIFNHN